MLIIAEKPETGKEIASALGTPLNSFKTHIVIQAPSGDVLTVTWALGHVLRLKYPNEYNEKYSKWNLENLPLQYPSLNSPEFIPVTGKEEWVGVLKGLIQDPSYQTIVHAGDIDAEGQLIVDSLLMHFHNDKPVKRLLINSVVHEDIRDAWENLEDNAKYQSLTSSALARTASDMLYGFSLTQLYTLLAQREGLNESLSVGRVQTPTLGLVVKRYFDNKSFKSSSFYDLQSEMKSLDGALVFDSRIHLSDEQKEGFFLNEKGKFEKKEEVQSLIDRLKGVSGKVLSVETKLSKKSAPLPYNITLLQREAFKKYKYKPKKVIQVTQSLREKHKCITYNRTDCQYLKEKIFPSCPGIFNALLENFAGRYTKNNFDLTIKGKAFDDTKVSAHHGIIPTTTVLDVKTLNDEEFNIYQMIADRFCIQFLEPESSNITKVSIKVDDCLFTSTSKIVVNPGFTLFFKEEDEENEEEINKADLSLLTVDDELSVSMVVTEGKTGPPRLYNQGELIYDLTRISKYVTNPYIRDALLAKDEGKLGENGSIGTGATRDQIIDQLINERGFIDEKANGDLVPTEKGLSFVKYLPAETLQPDMTAVWYLGMEAIQASEKSLDEFMNELNEYLNKHVSQVKNSGLKIEIEGVKAFPCPDSNCSGKIIKRETDKSTFWGCTEFRNGCKITYQDVEGEPLLESYVCPACNENDLRFINHNGSKFWSCSGYKDNTCNASFQHSRGKPVLELHHCPNCKTSLLRRIKSEKGWFWGCAGYNNKEQCTSSFQDYKGKPLLENHDCPICDDGKLRYIKGKKGSLDFWSCSNFTNGCKALYQDKGGSPLILGDYTCRKCNKHKLRQVVTKDRKKFWVCLADDEVCKATYPDYLDTPVLEEFSCPKCAEGNLRLLHGSKGYFWTCDQYTAEVSCKTVLSDDGGKPKLQ